ncbi:MAG TPA: hypothetical protein VGX91_00740 [Candidatus Cybelea sp.]|jgi:hypothetical protein|nr:hypothetical protein [Candidatus Cybelea sp.]
MKAFADALGIALATAMLAGCGGSAMGLGAPYAANISGDTQPYHQTFHFTGAPQSFVVPAGVKTITVIALGAAGGGLLDRYDSHSATGGRVYAKIPVLPGEKLLVYVGSAGYVSSGKFYGGYNGGGNPGIWWGYGYGGGGASDVRIGGNKLIDRVLVAGGGGGGGGYNSGGYGGGGGRRVGGAGQGGNTGFGGDGGGGGGTQRQGGAGGSGGQSGYRHGKNGTRGTFGSGGTGGNAGYGSSSSVSGGSGGGGGGGYYGGGGGGGGHGGGGGSDGSAGAGGGGGSSWVASGAQRVRMWRGWKTATGNGLVVFDW